MYQQTYLPQSTKQVAIRISLMLALIPGWGGLASANEPKTIKTIAPDLIVKSLELGEFDTKSSSFGDEPDLSKFHPTDVFESGNFAGYCIKLNTRCRKILLSEESDLKQHELPWKKGQGQYVEPVNGCIYRAWPMVDGYPAGKHWFRLHLNDVELPVIYYTVRR